MRRALFDPQNATFKKKKRARLILRHSHMGGIYWDVLGETVVYSQQCQYQKTYSLAAFVFS